MSDTKNDNLEFLTVGEFKSAVSADRIRAVRNPKTGKLFMTDGVRKWRCEGDLDVEGDVKVLVEDGNLDDACMVNVDDSKNVVAEW